MNALDKFTVGQRVVPTAKARLFRWRAPKPYVGIVKAIPDRYPHWTVDVQLIGQKHPRGYHMDLWEPLSKVNTVRVAWRCEKCRQRGSVTFSAHMDVWGGGQAVMYSHRLKSPKCRANGNDVRVTLPPKKRVKSHVTR